MTRALKSFKCLFRGAFVTWLVWRVTLFLQACVCFLNPMLFQPMDLLGFSAFPEDLKPTPIVLHVNQHGEVLTHVGFIRDDIPSS